MLYLSLYVSLLLLVDPYTTGPTKTMPPPPLVPSQDYNQMYGLGSPAASATAPPGTRPIVYNSPSSSLRFVPSQGSDVIIL